MKKIILFLLLAFLSLSKTTFAQTPEEEAEVYYENAEKAYDIKDYLACENALVKCIQKLGSTNTKIDYLRIRDMYDQVSNSPDADSYKNYMLLKSTITDFFQKVNKATYPEEKYKEIIFIKLAIADKLDYYNNQKTMYAGYKNREQKFLTDTVDIYMRKFVDAYNKAWDNLSNTCKKKGFSDGKVGYDSTKNFVYYINHPDEGFDYKNLRISQDHEQYIISNIRSGGIKLVSNTIDPHRSFFPTRRPDPHHREGDDGPPCTIDVGAILTDLIGIMKTSGFDAYYRGDYKDMM